MANSGDRPATLLLKPETVAERLQLGRSKTYELLRTGVIPSVRLGSSRRVKAHDLEAYVARLATEREQPT